MVAEKAKHTMEVMERLPMGKVAQAIFFQTVSGALQMVTGRAIALMRNGHMATKTLMRTSAHAVLATRTVHPPPNPCHDPPVTMAVVTAVVKAVVTIAVMMPAVVTTVVTTVVTAVVMALGMTMAMVTIAVIHIAVTKSTVVPAVVGDMVLDKDMVLRDGNSLSTFGLPQ